MSTSDAYRFFVLGTLKSRKHFSSYFERNKSHGLQGQLWERCVCKQSWRESMNESSRRSLWCTYQWINTCASCKNKLCVLGVPVQKWLTDGEFSQENVESISIDSRQPIGISVKEEIRWVLLLRKTPLAAVGKKDGKGKDRCQRGSFQPFLSIHRS